MCLIKNMGYIITNHGVGKMRFFKAAVAGLFFVVGLFIVSSEALAMTPSLSIYSSGGNSVSLTVNGDPNSSVFLYYYTNGGGSIISTAIGSTNQNGYFSTTLDSNSFSIGQNSSVYAMVNGSQSNSVNWPSYNYNNGGSISLSQSSVYLSSGQSANVSIYGGGNNYYISSNSNSGAVSASLSGNTINVYGYYSGSSNITVCSNSSSYGCVILYVTVSGNNMNYYNQTPVSVSQSNVSLGIGQSMDVGIYGGTGTYYVSSNSNQNIASVSISNGTVTVYGRQIGSSSITICSSVLNTYSSSYNNNNSYAYNSCANLVINVGTNYVYGYSPLSTLPLQYPPVGQYSSGVILSQVPYTGFGPSANVAIFTFGLWVWSASLAYFIVNKGNLVSAANLQKNKK